MSLQVHLNLVQNKQLEICFQGIDLELTEFKYNSKLIVKYQYFLNKTNKLSSHNYS